MASAQGLRYFTNPGRLRRMLGRDPLRSPATSPRSASSTTTNSSVRPSTKSTTIKKVSLKEIQAARNARRRAREPALTNARPRGRTWRDTGSPKGSAPAPRQVGVEDLQGGPQVSQRSSSPRSTAAHRVRFDAVRRGHTSVCASDGRRRKDTLRRRYAHYVRRLQTC